MDWSYLFASTYIYRLLRQEVKDTLQKYNAEAIQNLSPQEICMK